jgi:Flp pilus assembly protein TadG
LGGREILNRERGSVTVELFLVLPVAILVLVASLQIIGVARTRIELQGAAREGARVAATTPDPSKAVEAVLASLSPEARPAARVSVERPSRVGAMARVSVSMRRSLGPPFPDSVGIDLSATAAMRTER